LYQIDGSSVITITGGTGSFGTTLVNSLLNRDVNEIRIFSRDERKQDFLRNKIKDERVKFFIGDTRDFQSVTSAIKGSDFVFHAAALKQVPSCEFFPMQAVATNIQGSENVIRASFENEIKSIVCLSTDKAVYPINTMGMTKAVMEKIAQSYARNFPKSETKISVTRYGNVMMSRGSVIPLFFNQIKSGVELTVTDLEMTRFMMSLQDSVELVLHAFNHGNSGDLFVKKAPAASVRNLIGAIEIILKIQAKIQMIGVRHGEKKHESLLGTEEKSRSIDEGKYFKIPLDTRNLDYQIYFEKGLSSEKFGEAYTSENTEQLNSHDLANLIISLPEYSEYLESKEL